MKNIFTIALFALLAIATVPAQTFDIKANYTITNWITAGTSGSTNIFSGATNDMRFYRNTVWYVKFQSDNADDTNSIDIVFRDAPDATGTNWLSRSNFITVTARGTNLVWEAFPVTNYPHALIEPVAYTNRITGNLTNFSLQSASKGYTKDK